MQYTNDTHNRGLTFDYTTYTVMEGAWHKATPRIFAGPSDIYVYIYTYMYIIYKRHLQQRSHFRLYNVHSDGRRMAKSNTSCFCRPIRYPLCSWRACTRGRKREAVRQAERTKRRTTRREREKERSRSCREGRGRRGEGKGGRSWKRRREWRGWRRERGS